MNPWLLFAVIMAPLAACAPWPPQSTALDARAGSMTAPPLLPSDQLFFPPGYQAQSSGAALQARAAALRALAAGI